MHILPTGPELRYDPAPDSPSDNNQNAAALQGQASRCRRLAQLIGDADTVDRLARMAAELEARGGECKG